MTFLNDNELLQKIQLDDRLAFSEIVHQYSDILFRFIRKRIPCEDDCKDIMQEIFTSLWHRRQTIKIEKSLYPYLFKAAQFKIIDYMVNKKNEINRSVDLQTIMDLPCNSSSSEESLLFKELEQLIFKEVDKMPKNVKSVFYKSRQEFKTIKDIAVEMSLSEQTVKNNISIAIHRLRLKFK